MENTFFFLKMLKDKILPFGRARKTYIMKFRNIELIIDGNVPFQILGA